MSKHLLTKAFLSFVFLALSFQTYAQQYDTVLTSTGEVFIGTAERLGQAVLTFDSRSGDSDYKIEWKDVVSINTHNQHRVTYNKQEIVIAYFRDSDPTDNLVKMVREDGTVLELTYYQILSSEKISDNFWGKMDMNLNLGYSYAKATKTHQLTLRTSAAYLSDRWGVDGFYDEFFSLIDTTQSNRTEAALNTQYFLRSAYYFEANANWFSSDEQQIALRTTLMGGFGRFLLKAKVCSIKTILESEHDWSDSRLLNPK